MDARLLLAVAAAPVLVAGCGGRGGSPHVASLTPTSPAHTTSTAPIVPRNGSFARFVTCMQHHGIQAQLGPQGRGISISLPGGSKARVAVAQTACQKYLPGGGPPALTPAQRAEQNRALLAMARCMRRNGVPNFPDPNAQGQFDPGSSIDKSSPAVQAAVEKCSKLMPKHFGLRVAHG